MLLVSHFLRVALLATMLLIPSVARSGVPDPVRSFHDPCLIVCPFGDVSFTVIVRDIGANPIANSTVTLDFSQCGFVHCPASQQGGAIVNESARTMTLVSDASGTVRFHLAMGGCCPGVRIFADGVLLGTVNMASPDQDGSLLVNGADAAILNGSVGHADPCGDLTCDGLVDAGDVAYLTGHLGHSCGAVVPARPMSWGRMKTIYR